MFRIELKPFADVVSRDLGISDALNQGTSERNTLRFTPFS